MKTPTKNKQRSTRKKPAMFVDKVSFIDWLEGTLLRRDKWGRCVVGDNVVHEKAEKLLKKGEAIGFTVGGKPVSTIQLEGEGRGKVYKEREIES